jgi:hypothetical protein
MKMMVTRIVGACLALALAGCATVGPVGPIAMVEPRDVRPDLSSGYVAGLISRESNNGVALVVRNIFTGNEYNLPLGDGTPLTRANDRELVAIRLPPGRYEIPAWITISTLSRQREMRTPVSNAYLAAPFEVHANSVVFLGKFLLSSWATYVEINPQPISAESARQALAASYPGLGGLEFACKLCKQPPPVAKRPPWGMMAPPPSAG